MADLMLLGLMGAGLVGLASASESVSKNYATKQQLAQDEIYAGAASDRLIRAGSIPPGNIRDYIFTDHFARARFVPTGETVAFVGGQRRVMYRHPVTGQLVFGEHQHHGQGQGL